MSLTTKEIQKIRGIGDVLAVRLLESGHDTFTKIANLGESGLKTLKGINPKAVTDILQQARSFAASEISDRDRKITSHMDSLQGLRQSVQTLTVTAKDRFKEKLSGKTGRKLTEALVGFIEAVETVEGKAGQKLKKTGKGLLKAEKHLQGLAEAGLKDLRKGLKKAKKTLQKVHK